MIPNIIHQIWLGDKPAPIALMRSWRKQNPSWSYHLWTDNNLPRIYNVKQFNEAKDVRMKSDILRYEIIYRYGGIYADCDFHCLRSFGLLTTSDLFVGLGWEYKTGAQLYYNGLFGASRYNPFIRYLISKISEMDLSHTSGAATKTGPNFFTKAVYDRKPEITVYPQSYFYPIDEHDTKTQEITNSILDKSFAIHYWHGSKLL